MTQSLGEFFKEKKERADIATAGIDWHQRLREWLANIELLYGNIRAWLLEPVQAGSVDIDFRPKQIVEDHLGIYIAQELVLKVGDEKVIFSPRARNVAGAIGRIDVQGERGEAMLIVQPGPRWLLVTEKYPQLRTVSLDESTFADLLQSVMRA